MRFFDFAPAEARPRIKACPMPLRTPLTPVQLHSLEQLCRTLASNDNLHRWFISLEKLPFNLRMNAIMQITSEMRHNDEDPDLIAAICCLSDTDVFTAAVQTVAELDS
jgi:hypothetical protein